MRILADECCPLSVVEALRRDGHDVWDTASEASSSTDSALLARSVAEERVLLTLRQIRLRRLPVPPTSHSIKD